MLVDPIISFVTWRSREAGVQDERRKKERQGGKKVQFLGLSLPGKIWVL